MTIYELMSTKTKDLKTEIVNSINNILIARGHTEIEIEEASSIDDVFRFRYDALNSNIKYYRVTKSVMSRSISELLFLLRTVENEEYEC